MQGEVALGEAGFGVTLPQRFEGGLPFTAQPTVQRGDNRLIRGIQRLEMVFGDVGVEADPVLLVAITLGDFEDAAGADGLVDRLAQGAALWIDALHHHGRIANGHEPSALEHMHQGQRAVCLAHCGRAAGKDGAVDRRDERHFIPDLEDLFDIQGRKAKEAFRPGLVGIEAAPEVAENGFDVPRL
ncbi:hypothetical protein [Pseudomonas sp. 8 R 14]|nr:hypothetical protein [Pseudomonas sp. 8 R 14]SAM32814.1 hypothetical protein BN1864_LIB5394:02861 [Pseudomonas sp. 1 R 17]